MTPDYTEGRRKTPINMELDVTGNKNWVEGFRGSSSYWTRLYERCVNAKWPKRCLIKMFAEFEKSLGVKPL